MYSFLLLLLLLPYSLSKSVFDSPSDEPVPREPHWWKVIWLKHRIQELRVAIPPRLYRFFSADPQLPFVLKESIESALASCKQSNIEKDEKLTCTVQSGRPLGDLFKTVSAYDSRDFSFLLSLTTAFAVRSISIACAEGRLKKCSCDKKHSGPISGRPSGFYWNACHGDGGSHNLPYAFKLSRKLIDHQYECVVPVRLREVLLHNIALGRTRVSSSVFCRCEPRLSCHKKLCQLKTSEEAHLINRVRESLWHSHRMRRSNLVDLRVGVCHRGNRDRKYKNRPIPLWYIDDGRGQQPAAFFLGVPT